MLFQHKACHLISVAVAVMSLHGMAASQAAGRSSRPDDRPVHESAASETTGRVGYEIKKTTDQVRIDAMLDEPVWQTAAKILLPFEVSPGDNTLASVATACHVAYDDKNLYFAFVASDPNPEQIRAYITDRDDNEGQDRVAFVIDPFNDLRRAFDFTVTPLGVQDDSVFDQQDGSSDDSWDAIWSSAGRLTDNGFVVEAAIPFKSLRFPETDEIQTWGFYAQRIRPRSERTEMRSMRVDWSNSCQLCQANLLIGIQNVAPGKNIQIAPSLTSSRTDERPAFPDGNLLNDDVNGDFGLDLSYGITSDLTLNATINPDFSQVEADVAQLDVNNQFALFFPEKRPFFLEGADLFATPLTAVFTRTIADPLFGTKLSGKVGSNVFGALLARDDVNNLLFPGS
jgi:hypothetical protein